MKKSPLSTLLTAAAFSVAAMLLLSACTAQTPSGDDTSSTPSDSAASSGADNNSSAETDASGSSDTQSSDSETAAEIIDTLNDSISVKFTSYEQNVAWEEKADATITLEGDTASADGRGVSIDGTTITITQKGTYVFSGVLNDGQILVEVPDTDKVRLVMNGVDITCTQSAPLYVRSADKAVLLMAEGTTNTFTDGAAYTITYDDGTMPNACIYSRCDLVINGSGKLVVNASYNNGIGSKDDIKILGATVEVSAFKNGIKGTDSVTIADAEITIQADNDGIKSDQEGKADKGFIYIKSGTISINAGDDALQAFTLLVIRENASVTAVYGGKEINCDGTLDVAEGSLQSTHE